MPGPHSTVRVMKLCPAGLDQWFDEATPENQLRFGRANMLMSPGRAASAVMQWMQNPELKEGQFLPEHLQIAAYIGQHTVRPVTRNEYLRSEIAMGAYSKELASLDGKGVYRWENHT